VARAAGGGAGGRGGRRGGRDGRGRRGGRDGRGRRAAGRAGSQPLYSAMPKAAQIPESSNTVRVPDAISPFCS
jgi:hypothetical protein